MLKPRKPGLSTGSRAGLLLPLLAVAALVGVAPFLAALRGSFLHDYFGRILPAGLNNYRYILEDKAFSYSLNITVLWAVLQTALTVSFGLLIAYRLWRRGKRGRLLHVAVLVPWGVPVYIAVPVWRALIHGDGEPFNLLLQPLWGFLFPLVVSVWLTLPATVFILYSGFKKIGRRMVEAAALDGADDSTIAFSICFPQLREILLSVVLINFVKALKEFNVVFLMTAGGPPLLQGITERYIIGATTTLSIFLYDLFTASTDYGVSSAFSVLLSLVVITATLIYLIGRSHNSRSAKRLLLGLPVVVQLLTGGLLALPLAALYLLVLWRPGSLSCLLGLHTLAMGALLFFRGFPEGLQPALAVSLAVWLIFRRNGTAGSRIGRIGSRQPLTLKSAVFKAAWRGSQLLLPAAMIAAAVSMVLALLWLSFSGLDAVTFDSLLPPTPGLRAYHLAFGPEQIHRYFYNSFLVALSTALLLPFIAFPAAWVIARGRGRTGALILATVQLLGTVSGMHALIPLYIIFRSMGVINTYIPLVLIYLEHSFVFSLFTMSAFLRNLPSSLREAALLEGAGSIYYLRKVLMPLSRPVLFATMIVAFLGAWNGFLPALLFIRDDWKYTIGVKIYTFVGSIASGSPQWSVFAATSVINMLILVLLFMLMKRYGGSTALAELEE
ncbi:MAG: ABC transporter permease subunit [Spirochaetota bacterium]